MVDFINFVSCGYFLLKTLDYNTPSLYKYNKDICISYSFCVYVYFCVLN